MAVDVQYTQVGTLVPVEPLGDAYTGPLFTLWEGLYRRFTNPVGALLAGCAGCRISLYRVYKNPVRVLHGLCLHVPYGTYATYKSLKLQ